ncbi:alpha-amylase family protein [Oerskovia flava]|uniref:alpha-amylase family protein n=1 Tax=Oerskovia flava TaxID=2986422 RepID=UPI00223E98F8|nr:alpha-amylase family protein [Oerskovia sp. JB1-3-2]
MRITDTGDLWWKTAVVYCLDVETYLDWNDDGTGDLEGLAHRLDYLAELGVTCLWLMPFYPSPGKDNGYDVADFYGVDPRFGHLGDFVEVVRTAKDRGMRVIVDLVVNHTSDQHPWFRAARASRSSPYRDYYVWADEPPEDQPPNMFPDVEEGVWTFDERAGQYYRHSFYGHQPDLDTGALRVREEISKVVGFWLELGVDGFRVDSVPHTIDAGGSREHTYLRSLRRDIVRRSGSGMMLGEVNLPYEEQLDFFGENGDELTMQFDFFGNQRLYLALARQDARPLAEALAARPALDRGNQWANFVRNHDELTLDLLTQDEREEIFAAFAPEERMRIHGRGIVRRLPSMLEGDPRRIRMVYSLMFSLPGAPVLYYGEEIGMAENPEVAGRSAVRPPMQWSATKNGGFSAVRPSRLVAPVVADGFGPAHVNVADQRYDPDSLLRFVSALAHRYRNAAEIGWGEMTVLEQPHPCVFAHTIRGETGQIVALHNFAPDGRSIPLVLDDVPPGTRILDVLDADEQVLDDEGRLEIALEGYGYRWFRVLREGEKRLA